MPAKEEHRLSQAAADEWAALLMGLPRNVCEDLRAQINLAAPPSFFEFAKQALSAAPGAMRRSVSTRILLDHNLVIRAAADPTLLGAAEAHELMALTAVLDPQVGARLIRHLSSPNRIWPEEVPGDEALRVLELIERLPGLNNLLISLLKFTQAPDKKVRSKSAKLLGFTSPTLSLCERVFADNDARVKANLVEGIAMRGGTLTPPLSSFLRNAAATEAPRLSCMALLALAKSGDAEAEAKLKDWCDHPNPVRSKSARFGYGLLEKSRAPEPAPPAEPQPVEEPAP